ncbi:hypothetical protein BESB_037200 [Besnoitia besnoiti]|uniref:Uncharacterized protein n=1 Tax=Besnoitia besnoiti TaxID=94643 RepID=A0A2A9MNK3_BESBE|nr:hypothetical protein BESB_037200 [Besnoitia besnoiti]PFH37262.1 hypothetical protein BESB_037200 [Besnoitia besnoiti]
MAAAVQYPTPYPAYTEQYVDGTTSANVYGAVQPQTMACWAGAAAAGNTPLFTPPIYPSMEQVYKAQQSAGFEQMNTMQNGGLDGAVQSGVPSTSASYASLPACSPEQNTFLPPVHHQVGTADAYTMNTIKGNSLMTPNTNVVGGPDASMQTFQHHFGQELSFYQGIEGSAMPQGFHAALAAQNQMTLPASFAQEPVRKAVKKALPPPPPAPQMETPPPQPPAPKVQMKKRRLFCC